MVSPTTIASDEVRQCLVKEIAYLWITILEAPGRSITRRLMGKVYIKGKHSLRKELASSVVVVTDHN